MKRLLSVLIASMFLASAAFAADGEKGKGDVKKSEAKEKGKGDVKKSEAKDKGQGDTKKAEAKTKSKKIGRASCRERV